MVKSVSHNTASGCFVNSAVGAVRKSPVHGGMYYKDLILYEDIIVALTVYVHVEYDKVKDYAW